MMKRKSLKGMAGIYVVVEDLGSEFKGTVTRRDVRSTGGSPASYGRPSSS